MNTYEAPLNAEFPSDEVSVRSTVEKLLSDAELREKYFEDCARLKRLAMSSAQRYWYLKRAYGFTSESFWKDPTQFVQDLMNLWIDGFEEGDSLSWFEKRAWVLSDWGLRNQLDLSPEDGYMRMPTEIIAEYLTRNPYLLDEFLDKVARSFDRHTDDDFPANENKIFVQEIDDQRADFRADPQRHVSETRSILDYSLDVKERLGQLFRS